MSSQFTIPIKFGPDGCQVNLGDRICRETETLAIIQEFNRTYQAKLREIGNIGGGDNLQRRVNLQQDWIRDLTQQNEMLVKIVESLEKEAADKVALLAKKLETSTLSSEKANKNVTELDSKVKDLEKRISESPKQDDLEALQHKLRLKEEEINSVKRMSLDAETGAAELRNMVRGFEDENRTLKDTIFQANRELEKFYEQANTYVVEREEYKRKYAEAQAALDKLQNQFSTAQSRWQSDNKSKEGELERLQKENLKAKGEIDTIRRQSESMVSTLFHYSAYETVLESSPE
uniref:Uncharacterized protein n=1 Tax=Photinus pyralis TaxID=7054 RepID=A0A1Y1N3C3_PHOPY